VEPDVVTPLQRPDLAGDRDSDTGAVPVERADVDREVEWGKGHRGSLVSTDPP
jgi:hypothetical protein